jgi:serine protease AprX
MRLRGAAVWVIGVIALAFSAGSAWADNPHGPKVDDRVAMTADLSSPITPIPVIVFGKSLGGRKNPELMVKAQLYGQATAGTITPAQLDQLAADPNVAFIAPDTAVAAMGKPGSGTTTPTLTPLSFPNLKALYPAADNAAPAWAKGYTGQGIGVAIIDSGTVNDDFNNRLGAMAGANNGKDTYGHGELVSHIAAGCCAGNEYAGIAPAANVVTYNVDTGNGATTSDVIQGLIWVLTNQTKYNIKVVNLSLGETTPSNYDQNLLDTVVEAMETYYGILVVDAAGNGGPGTAVYAPANDPFGLSVGASDMNGTADPSDDVVTPWSTAGTTLDGFSEPGIVAPGRHIDSYLGTDTVLAGQAPADNWTGYHEYVSISGTSFSSPQVAGAAADVFQAHPTWTPGQVKWVLMNTAHPVAGSTAGELDVDAAVGYQGTPPDANAGLTLSQFGMTDWVNNLLQGNTQGWKQATWNQATWNGNSWKGQDWHQATWNANAWDQATWNQATWNQATWNAHSWEK